MFANRLIVRTPSKEMLRFKRGRKCSHVQRKTLFLLLKLLLVEDLLFIIGTLRADVQLYSNATPTLLRVLDQNFH